MRGTLELPDAPSLILPGLAQVNAAKTEAIDEIGALAKAIFTDPQSTRIIRDDISHEATVQHRVRPEIKLQAAIAGSPIPTPNKDPKAGTRFTSKVPISHRIRVMTIDTIDRIQLGILCGDGAATYSIQTVNIPRINLEDQFLQMILDSFRSHVEHQRIRP